MKIIVLKYPSIYNVYIYIYHIYLSIYICHISITNHRSREKMLSPGRVPGRIPRRGLVVRGEKRGDRFSHARSMGFPWENPWESQLPILDTLQRMTNSLLVNVDIPINIKRLKG